MQLNGFVQEKVCTDFHVQASFRFQCWIPDASASNQGLVKVVVSLGEISIPDAFADACPEGCQSAGIRKIELGNQCPFIALVPIRPDAFRQKQFIEDLVLKVGIDPRMQVLVVAPVV